MALTISVVPVADGGEHHPVVADEQVACRGVPGGGPVAVTGQPAVVGLGVERHRHVRSVRRREQVQPPGQHAGRADHRPAALGQCRVQQPPGLGGDLDEQRQPTRGVPGAGGLQRLVQR